jgi:hypothetical protein
MLSEKAKKLLLDRIREGINPMTKETSIPQPGKIAKFFGNLGFQTNAYQAWVKAGKPQPGGTVSPDDNPPLQPASHIDIRNVRVLISTVESLISEHLDPIIAAAQKSETTLVDKSLALIAPVAELKGILKVLNADDDTK